MLIADIFAVMTKIILHIFCVHIIAIEDNFLFKRGGGMFLKINTGNIVGSENSLMSHLNDLYFLKELFLALFL